MPMLRGRAGRKKGVKGTALGTGQQIVVKRRFFPELKDLEFRKSWAAALHRVKNEKTGEKKPKTKKQPYT